jgi:hypothetical protein
MICDETKHKLRLLAYDLQHCIYASHVVRQAQAAESQLLARSLGGNENRLVSLARVALGLFVERPLDRVGARNAHGVHAGAVAAHLAHARFRLAAKDARHFA